MSDPDVERLAQQIFSGEFLSPDDLLRSRRAEDTPKTFGRFKILREIGRGGMGDVFLAEDPVLGRQVALKVLTRASPQEIERFRREARIMANLTHPNIVPVHEIGDAEGRSYLTMQFVDGTTIDRAGLDRHAALDAIRQVALALHYAHEQGVIHRDMKPGNIMIDRFGRVYIMDFGVARHLPTMEGPALSVSGMIIGTPSYLSPEQARGEVHAIDARSDVYGLGATLYELMTGRQPYWGATLVSVLNAITAGMLVEPRKIRPEVPVDVENIILRCMEIDPERRYPSARALAEDIARYLQGEPVHARPISIQRRFRRTLRRHRSPVVLGIALGTIALSIGFVALQMSSLSDRDQLRTRTADLLLRAARSTDDYENQLMLRDIDITSKYPLLQDSERLAREAIKLNDGRLPEGYAELARALYRRGAYDEAIGDIERAIAQDPSGANHFLKAQILLDQYEEAMIQAQIAGDPDIHRQRQSEAALKKDTMLKAFQKSIDAGVSSPWRLDHARAIVADAEGKTPEALRHFEALLARPELRQEARLEAQARLSLGYVQLWAGRLEEARSSFTAAREIWRSDARCLAGLGYCDLIASLNAARTHLERGELLARAIQHLENALRCNPNSALAHFGLGQALMFQANIEASRGGNNVRELGRRAIESFQRGLALDPKNLSVWCDIAQTFVFLARTDFVQGIDPQPVLDQATQAISKAPQSDHYHLANRLLLIHLFKARILQRKGEDPEPVIRKAQEIADRSLAYQENVEILHSLGNLYLLSLDYRQGHHLPTTDVIPLARRAFERARDLAAQSPMPLIGLATLEFMASRSIPDRTAKLEALTRAIELYENARKLGNATDDMSNEGLAFLHRAEITASLKDFDRARECLEQAISQDPADSNAQVNLGLMFAIRAQVTGATSDYESAIAALRRAVAMNPSNAIGWSHLGTVLLATKGKPEDAEQALSFAIQSDPSDAVAFRNRGVARMQMGKRKDAVADWRQAIRLDRRLGAELDPLISQAEDTEY